MPAAPALARTRRCCALLAARAALCGRRRAGPSRWWAAWLGRHDADRPGASSRSRSGPRWRQRTLTRSSAGGDGVAVLAGLHDYLVELDSPLIDGGCRGWVGQRIFLLHYGANLLLVAMGGAARRRASSGALQLAGELNRTLESRVADRERQIADKLRAHRGAAARARRHRGAPADHARPARRPGLAAVHLAVAGGARRHGQAADRRRRCATASPTCASPWTR